MNMLKDLQEKYFKAIEMNDRLRFSLRVGSGIAATVSVIICWIVKWVVSAFWDIKPLDIFIESGSVLFCTLVLFAFYGLTYFIIKKKVEESFQKRISEIENFLKENNLNTAIGIDWILESYKSKRGVAEVILGIIGKVIPVGTFFLGMFFQDMTVDQKVSGTVLILGWVLVFIVGIVLLFLPNFIVGSPRTRKYLIEDLGYVKTQLSS